MGPAEELHSRLLCPVVPASLLEKYDLKPGNAIMAEEKHAPLYEARGRGGCFWAGD